MARREAEFLAAIKVLQPNVEEIRRVGLALTTRVGNLPRAKEGEQVIREQERFFPLRPVKLPEGKTLGEIGAEGYLALAREQRETRAANLQLIRNLSLKSVLGYVCLIEAQEKSGAK